MRRLTRWLRRCFPVPAPAMRYEPRHLALVPLPSEPRTEPIAILGAPARRTEGHPIGDIRVWAPEAERLIEPGPLAPLLALARPEPERAAIVTGEQVMWANRYGTLPADPADAVFDYALSWGAAWKAHERGDEAAVDRWLSAGWLADAWWVRAARPVPCAA